MKFTHERVKPAKAKANCKKQVPPVVVFLESWLGFGERGQWRRRFRIAVEGRLFGWRACGWEEVGWVVEDDCHSALQFFAVDSSVKGGARVLDYGEFVSGT